MPGNNNIREIKTRLSLDGETAFRKSLKSVDSSLSAMKAEMKNLSTSFDESTDAMAKNEKKSEILKRMQEQLKIKVDALAGAVVESKTAYDEARKKAEELTKEYGENSEKAKIAWAEVETLGNKMDRMATMSFNAKSKLNDVDKQLRDLETPLKNASEKADDATENIDDMGKKAEGSANDGFTVLKGAAADLVSEGLGKVFDITKDVIAEFGNLDTVTNNFAIKTGASAAEMQGYSDSLNSMYNKGIGDSLGGISDSMAIVKQSLRDLPTDGLEEVTEYVLSLEDAFGYDAAESMRAANSLVDQFGIAYSDAFDLIVQGAQQGLDQNGDLLDVINEYSVQFKDMGYNAEEMFNMLSNAAESGTWSVDELGNAVKEFNIKLSEGSADEALGNLGINIDEVKSKFAEGGESAKSAQQEIITALMGVEDENQRYILGQQLMGTMWEDLGETTVAALFNTQGEISTTKDAMQEVIDLQYDDIGSKLEEVGRQAKSEIVKPLVEKALPKIEDGIEWVSDNLDDLVPVIETLGTAIVTVFAVKKVVEFGKTTINTIKSVKTAFTALNTTNPLGWIQIGVTAVTALGTAFIAAKKRSENYYRSIRDEAAKFSEKQQEIYESVSDTAEKWKDFTDDRSTMDDEVDTKYQKVSDLKEALDGLVDADGRVKKGSEEEVQTILDSLSDYTGTVLGISDGVLTKNDEVITSYQSLSTELDNLIEKQRASALITVYEEKYTEMSSEKKQLIKDVTDTQSELRAINAEIETLTQKQRYVYNGGSLPAEEQAQLEGYRKKRDELLEIYASGQDSLAEMTDFMTQYENAMTAMSSGDYTAVIENMNKISAGFATANTASAGQLKKQYDELAESYKEIVKLHETNPGIYTEKDVEDAKKLMDLALQEYEKKTNEFIDTSAITGREYIQGLAYSTISNSEKLNSARKYIEQKLADGDSLKEIAKDLGIEYDETLSTALKDGHISIGSASNYLANTVLNEFRSSNPKLISATNQNMTDVVGSIKAYILPAANAANDFAAGIINTLNSNSGNFYNAGRSSGDAWVKGFRELQETYSFEMSNGHKVWSPLLAEVSKMPHFATGTDNFKGGFAVINENQKGELVNLPNGSQVIPHDISLRYAEEAASRASVTNNTFGNININISAPNLNGQAAARAVAFEISDKVVSQIAQKLDRQKNRYSSAIGR